MGLGKLEVFVIYCVSAALCMGLFVTYFTFPKSFTQDRLHFQRQMNADYDFAKALDFNRRTTHVKNNSNKSPSQNDSTIDLHTVLNVTQKEFSSLSPIVQMLNNGLVYRSVDADEVRLPMVVDIDQNVPEMDALYRQLVVVTAFSLNHMREGLGMIASAQKVMPNTRIIVYDIGLDRERVIQKVKTSCNVELRTFDFHKYPPYVSALLTYAWKVIIIKETLNEFGAIFWADSSVRFTKSLRALLPFAVEHHGYLSRIHSYSALTVTPVEHNFNYTSDHMFEEFGIDKQEYARSPYAPHLAANRQLIINSSTVQQNYVRPMYACALKWTCISPPGAHHGIHRYDASALMLVIHKYFPGEFNRENDHLEDFDNAMFVYRKSDDWHNAKQCEMPNQ